MGTLSVVVTEQDMQLIPERAGHSVEPAWRSPGSVNYDAVDRRLMDTFPASDAVARY